MVSSSSLGNSCGGSKYKSVDLYLRGLEVGLLYRRTSKESWPRALVMMKGP